MGARIRHFALLVAMALLAGPVAVSQSAAAQRVPAGYTEIPVPVTMIYAGQEISGAALGLRRVPNRYLATAQVVVDPDQLEGKLARSTLVPGRPIAINQVREPDVINASRPVKIIYRAGGLLITGEAIPLASASVGELIRARNVDTGVIVSGTAQADGTLLVAGQ